MDGVYILTKTQIMGMLAPLIDKLIYYIDRKLTRELRKRTGSFSTLFLQL